MTPYYNKPNFKLFLGDSLKLLTEFKPESFDMVFADPPYHLSNGGFTVHAGKRTSVNKGEWDISKGVEKDLNLIIPGSRNAKDYLNRTELSG